MNATEKSIAFLRTLTLDGFLTSEEVWSLARFFNEHRECAESWPGNLLSPMLGSAFDDAKLTEEEMTLLAETISSIEQEWIASHPDLKRHDERSDLPIAAAPAQMPVIDLRIEVPSIRYEGQYVVMLKEHSCTCPEWQTRKGKPLRHLGRCCKHVAYAFMRTGKVFEPWFLALLNDCFTYARGTDPELDWRLLEVPGFKPALISAGHGDWCTVFAAANEGYESYVFNRLDKRWSYGHSPVLAGLIERAIDEQFRAGEALAAS